MKKYLEKKELNRIEKRAIEALAIVPVIRAVSQRSRQERSFGNIEGSQSARSISARSKYYEDRGEEWDRGIG